MYHMTTLIRLRIQAQTTVTIKDQQTQLIQQRYLKDLFIQLTSQSHLQQLIRRQELCQLILPTQEMQ